MTALLTQIDDVLRCRSVRPPARLWSLVRLGTYIVVFGMIYGGVMGSFEGISGPQVWQSLFAAIKVPILLLATFLIGLPSFFILNLLFGLRDDFNEAIRALFAAQAGLAIALASLAPFTLLWYASSADYAAALRFNAVMFGVASLAGQKLLRDYYRPLIQRNRRHRYLMWIWLAIYVFVGIQMSWTLRPYIGARDEPIQFFRESKFDNAYVIVGQLFIEMIRR